MYTHIQTILTLDIPICIDPHNYVAFLSQFRRSPRNLDKSGTFWVHHHATSINHGHFGSIITQPRQIRDIMSPLPGNLDKSGIFWVYYRATSIDQGHFESFTTQPRQIRDILSPSPRNLDKSGTFWVYHHAISINQGHFESIITQSW